MFTPHSHAGGRIVARVALALTLLSGMLIAIAPAASAATIHAARIAAAELPAVEAMAQLDRDFLNPREQLYVVTGGQHEPEAALWPTSQALAAAIAVARVTRAAADLARVRRIIDSLHAYLAPDGAYHARVVRSLRYYDDNNWVALDLLDAAQLLHDPTLLEPVKRIFAFLITGWDAKLGGGIIWADGNFDRPTVSSAPAISIALRLEAATHDATYRVWADRLYNWMNTTLRAPNGLYYDHVNGITGAIDRDIVSYNQGVMIQANLDYYTVTGQASYLREAVKIAAAAAKAFQGPWHHTGNYAAFDAIYFAALGKLNAVSPNAASLAPARAYLQWAWPVASATRVVRDENALLEQSAFVLTAASVG